MNLIEEAFETCKNDPQFNQELDYYLRQYVGRPNPLYYAEKLTRKLGGAKIYLKREELNHTGSHKINNAIGQVLIAKTHSISAGLDYAGVGPEHSYLKDSGRGEYVSITDQEALDAFYLLSRTEGIIPALESAHAVAYAAKLAPTLSPEKIIIVNLSGRGDKDVQQIFDMNRG